MNTKNETVLSFVVQVQSDVWLIQYMSYIIKVYFHFSFALHFHFLVTVASDYYSHQLFIIWAFLTLVWLFNCCVLV
jgi:hypothetical protein